jgi:hypothetical protein
MKGSSLETDVTTRDSNRVRPENNGMVSTIILKTCAVCKMILISERRRKSMKTFSRNLVRKLLCRATHMTPVLQCLTPRI